jgi:hypothetical protein
MMYTLNTHMTLSAGFGMSFSPSFKDPVVEFTAMGNPPFLMTIA